MRGGSHFGHFGLSMSHKQTGACEVYSVHSLRVTESPIRELILSDILILTFWSAIIGVTVRLITAGICSPQG